jgi:hypothetical protein|tara:strand:- start:2598 stop:2861 length:264 start_codon:yes stop_codon:yes gene_type:complete
MACRDRDAERAAYAMLLVAAEDMRDGGPPPKWSLSLVAELLNVAKARIQYRKSHGQVEPMNRDHTTAGEATTAEAAAVIAFASNKRR